MKKVIFILMAILSINFSFAQWVDYGTTIKTNDRVETPTFIFSENFGDLRMRRASANDPTHRRALVPEYNASGGFSQLVMNYNGDFTNGVRVNGTKLIIDGKLGVGSQNPDEKLTVNGTVHAKEVKVDLSIPADYVFQKYYTGTSTLKHNYSMPTLEEVEAYTKANHHLPEVPSAQEIKDNGLHLKQMTNILLQKIEELTLYTIEQEKRIKALEARLENK